MFLKHIVWRKLIYGQVRRLTLGMQVPSTSKSFSKLKSDHALEWGNKNENPGVWSKFVGGDHIPITPEYYVLHLDNSYHDLKLWQGDNTPRGCKIKISQRLWHAPTDIIDIWYLGCMNILREILFDYNQTELVTSDSIKLYNFVSSSINELREKRIELYNWAKKTQENFKLLSVNPDFLFDDYFKKSKKDFIEQNYMAVICYKDDNGVDHNDAIMVNLKDPNLHPIIRSAIKSDCGSEVFNVSLKEV